MMLARIASTALFLLVACSRADATLAPPTERSTFTEAERDRILAVLHRQSEAWNRGDLEGFMAGYHRGPDVIFTSGAQIRRGWDETLATYRRKYGEGESMGQLRFADVEVQALGPDAAVVLGRFELTRAGAIDRGVFTLVFERRDDVWGIVHDHSSGEPPPAE